MFRIDLVKTLKQDHWGFRQGITECDEQSGSILEASLPMVPSISGFGLGMSESGEYLLE